MPKSNPPRSDDPWVKEDANLTNRKGELDKTLSDNYILSYIKTQEDAAKQVLSINAILMGIYLAFISNGQNLEAIKNLFIEPFSINFLDYTKSLDLSFFVSILLIAVPPVFWLISMIECMHALESRIELSEGSSNTEISSIFLKQIAKYKYISIRKSIWFMIFGLLVIFIFVVAILSQNVWPEYTWDEKGTALSNQGKYDEAIKAFDESIRINPNDAVAWYAKGAALFYQGKYDEAIKAFNESIRIGPNFAEAWDYKGNVLLYQGKYDEAIKAFNESMRINPNDAAAWYAKGTALFYQGKYDDAIKAFNESIRINPNNAIVQKNKVIALMDSGRIIEASAAFSKAKELGYIG